jgi:hypothetical protein
MIDLKFGAWKDTSGCHEGIRPELAGNSEFLVEIVEF